MNYSTTPHRSPRLSKDTTSSPHLTPRRGSPHPTPGYINADLANALRDSVVVNPSPSRSSYNPTPFPNSQSQHSFIGQQVYNALPSQAIDFSASPSSPSDEFEQDTGATGIFPVTQGGEYSGLAPALPPKSSPLLNHRPPSSPSPHPLDPPRQRKISSQSDYRMSMAQPQLPSQRVVTSANPFEQDEIEPPPLTMRKGSNGTGGNTAGVGAGNAARTKYTRAQTALAGGTGNPPSPHRTRARRSMSSGSYDAQGRELTAGQRRAAEDKKGSRHADVIDTWDPTGMGSAMWHHQGPYDAAAPSRNVNVPPVRAPMQVFNPADRSVQSPTRAVAAVTHAPAPPPPAKEPVHTEAAPAPERVSRRAQSAMRQTAASRRQSGGGLTGQYSTSVPASGGYFPDPDEPNDEASMLRKERQAQRDQKRRALKAAWGIDTPEPFEDFGGSPGEEGEINLADDAYPTETAAPAPRVRSPGLRLGLGGPRTPPIKDELSPVSEKGGSFNIPASGSVPAYGPGGVKRTKSLMQKIKGMVRTRSGSVEASGPYGFVRPGVSSASLGTNNRSQSMGSGFGVRPQVSPGWDGPDVVEEEEMVDEHEYREEGYSNDDVFGQGEPWRRERGYVDPINARR